jgi:hypothetical protein
VWPSSADGTTWVFKFALIIRRTFWRTLPILKGGRFVTTTALRCHGQNWQANSVVRIRTIEGNRSANHRLKWLKFLQCSHVVHAVGKFDDQDANILRCPCKDLAHKEARCIRHKWRAAKAVLHCTICIYARIGYRYVDVLSVMQWHCIQGDFDTKKRLIFWILLRFNWYVCCRYYVVHTYCQPLAPNMSDRSVFRVAGYHVLLSRMLWLVMGLGFMFWYTTLFPVLSCSLLFLFLLLLLDLLAPYPPPCANPGLILMRVIPRMRLERPPIWSPIATKHKKTNET